MARILRGEIRRGRAIGKRIGRASAEELDQVVDGLNEIVAT